MFMFIYIVIFYKLDKMNLDGKPLREAQYSIYEKRVVQRYDKKTFLSMTENEIFLLKLSKTRMPFGKYAKHLLIDLPESYVIWLSHKGFPKGELGTMLKIVYEIKINGLEYLFKPLR